MERRNFLNRLTASLTVTVAGSLLSKAEAVNTRIEKDMELKSPVKQTKQMGFQWETQDPFLFCVHHEDHFPAGNEQMGPSSALLKGREMGNDFLIKDGFRMYHGKTVPGFPGHPHRGFETVTVVREGMVDHADSLGAAGRYGNGDVQWMTAGKGIQHSEMFPLLNQNKNNPLELFQIWLNLPKKNKMVNPHFKMLWSEKIPHITSKDSKGKTTLVEVIAGTYQGKSAPAPPPNSWAADPKNCVCIWNIKMSAGASFVLPKTEAGINRTIYFYSGSKLSIGSTELKPYHLAELESTSEISLLAGTDDCSILLLQGKPIGEPVIQYGPFVMNTKEEINQTFDDYHKTQFGGWPWSRYDQVHARQKGRFAKHADGKEELPA